MIFANLVELLAVSMCHKFELSLFSGFGEEDRQRFQAKSNMADEPRDLEKN